MKMKLTVRKVDNSEKFCEITISKAESTSTSGEEDTDLLQMVLDHAYSCRPSLFTKCALDSAERASLLFQDKDFLNSEVCAHVWAGCVYT